VSFAWIVLLALHAQIAAPIVAQTAQAAATPTERSLSLEEAVAMALEHNESIVIQREDLVSAEAAGLRAHGAYDPLLGVQADYLRSNEPVNSPFSGAPAPRAAPTFKTYETLFSLDQLLPTGGSLAFRANASRQTTDGTFVLLTPAYGTRVGVEFRQPLLRGLSIDPARLALKVAAADRSRSAASLRKEVTRIVAAVEDGYWSLVSARQAVGVREEAVALADEQLSQTRARVDQGAAPKTEISQPTAEIERRRGELYAAHEALSRSENALKRLIYDAGNVALWVPRLAPADDPNITPERVDSQDLESTMKRALDQRPELAESKAEIERRRAEAAFADNLRKPGLDAFVSYDRLGLSGDLVDLDPNSPFTVLIPDYIEGGLGRSLAQLGEGRFDDTRAGVVLSVPIGNRAARGEAGIAAAAKRQAEAGLDGVRKMVLAEVLDAAAGVDTAAQRVETARAAREAAGVQLSAEHDRYVAGLSTNFLVLTRQNDLSNARLEEIAALTDYRRARTEMARATGSLLEERRIQVEDGAGGKDAK